MTRERTGHSKHALATIQEKTHGDHQIFHTKIRFIIFFAAKDEEALYSLQKRRLGADCGSDYELMIAKFTYKLKEVEKATRPFRYDLNQTPYSGRLYSGSDK